MNKLKKIPIIMSGVALIIFGLVVFFYYLRSVILLCAYYKGISGLVYVGFGVWLLILASCVLLVIPGILLFSFKEYARRVAISVYAILFIVGSISLWFISSFLFAYRPAVLRNAIFFSPGVLRIFFSDWHGVVSFLASIIPLFFIIVLMRSKEEFIRSK